jgi:hypothetical protein
MYFSIARRVAGSSHDSGRYTIRVGTSISSTAGRSRSTSASSASSADVVSWSGA